MTTPTEEIADAFAQMLVAYSKEFDERCDQRHALGAEKYGPGKFLTVDTLDEAIEEIVDLSNYARYTFIKLRMLQDALAESIPVGLDTSTFISARQATSVKEDKE